MIQTTGADMRFLIAFMIAGSLHAASNESGSWDPKTAANYLDQRAAWWIGWKSAARENGTFCVSCHTTLPYALARPAAASNQRVMENVTKRVRMWSEMKPLYPGQHAEESRGSEAILNAFLLMARDARLGQFSGDARMAMDQMLALQDKSGEQAGSFVWMNFHYQPWEAEDARFWGATMAAAALGMAPAEYRLGTAAAQVDLLRVYLAPHAEGQTLFNRASLLWATTKLKGVLRPAVQALIQKEIVGRQRADGGWDALVLVPSGWKRRDETPLETKGDGYATAFMAYVLRESGLGMGDLPLGKALGWLKANQDRESGSWPAWSLNKQRDPKSDAGKFMRDAATAYAVMALQDEKGR